ncbi:MAG: phosphopantothenoylcysteine decarboxylase [Verrucomicrobium sp.]|nr:phosphopantothenoylcysteine decarboxylase [Verrucomicrobium sp.]
MNLIVTCGPAYAPIDGTRRLTNHSTGGLGAFLCAHFAAAGHRVLCLRGSGATERQAAPGVEVREFGTNEDLAALLAEAAREPVDAVLHAAALCDFGAGVIRDLEGNAVLSGKIPSRAPGYLLTLLPLPKVIVSLRRLFPQAFLAGWKYGTEGGEEKMAAQGRRQLEEARTDLCVLNGPGFGDGYGLLTPAGEMEKAPTRQDLAGGLLQRIKQRIEKRP